MRSPPHAHYHCYASEWHCLLGQLSIAEASSLAVQRPVRDEAAFKARTRAASSVREKLLDVVKKLRTEVEATIARRVTFALCTKASSSQAIGNEYAALVA